MSWRLIFSRCKVTFNPVRNEVEFIAAYYDKGIAMIACYTCETIGM